MQRGTCHARIQQPHTHSALSALQARCTLRVDEHTTLHGARMKTAQTCVRGVCRAVRTRSTQTLANRSQLAALDQPHSHIRIWSAECFATTRKVQMTTRTHELAVGAQGRLHLQPANGRAVSRPRHGPQRKAPCMLGVRACAHQQVKNSGQQAHWQGSVGTGVLQCTRPSANFARRRGGEGHAPDPAPASSPASLATHTKRCSTL